MSTTIYHNPKCSKSRQTLQLLHENGIDADIVEYLNTPPDASTLEKILLALDMQPRDLMRKGQQEYKALNLANETLSRQDLIKAMIENPILIERPIVITSKGAAIGRPPENIKKVLDL